MGGKEGERGVCSASGMERGWKETEDGDEGEKAALNKVEEGGFFSHGENGQLCPKNGGEGEDFAAASSLGNWTKEQSFFSFLFSEAFDGWRLLLFLERRKTKASVRAPPQFFFFFPCSLEAICFDTSRRKEGKREGEKK